MRQPAHPGRAQDQPHHGEQARPPPREPASQTVGQEQRGQPSGPSNQEPEGRGGAPRERQRRRHQDRQRLPRRRPRHHSRQVEIEDLPPPHDPTPRVGRRRRRNEQRQPGKRQARGPNRRGTPPTRQPLARVSPPSPPVRVLGAPDAHAEDLPRFVEPMLATGGLAPEGDRWALEASSTAKRYPRGSARRRTPCRPGSRLQTAGLPAHAEVTEEHRRRKLKEQESATPRAPHHPDQLAPARAIGANRA